MVVKLPKCPACLNKMTVPIFQCQSGHSICNTCTTSLMPPVCPFCKLPITHTRNWQLEEMTKKALVPCPNKVNGCGYTMNPGSEEHVKECIFREMQCPLGAVFGRCSWQGKLNEVIDHFKECHAEHCDVNFDEDVVLKNVSVKADNRYFFLVAQNKLIFIITMKIDTQQKMAYWTIQHVGSKNGAKQYIYENHVTSNQDARRKVVFIDHCFNDVIKADEIFRVGKCAILPLNTLNHFIMDKMLPFRFFVKKIPPASLKNVGNDENNDKPPFQGPNSPRVNAKGSNESPKYQQSPGKAPNQNKV